MYFVVGDVAEMGGYRHASFGRDVCKQVCMGRLLRSCRCHGLRKRPCQFIARVFRLKADHTRGPLEPSIFSSDAVWR